MNKTLLSRIDARLLTEDEQELKDIIADTQQLMQKVNELNNEIMQCNDAIRNNLDQLNINLGTAIRRLQPKMNVTHRGDCCSCGYRSKDIVCKPNMQTRSWEISGRLGNHFLKRYPREIELSSNVTPLANAIANFFKQNYRSL